MGMILGCCARKAVCWIQGLAEENIQFEYDNRLMTFRIIKISLGYSLYKLPHGFEELEGVRTVGLRLGFTHQAQRRV